MTLVATREFASSRNMQFNLAYIGDDFPTEPKPSFETPYMRAVFRYGHDNTVSGNLWQKQIPFLAASDVVAVKALR